jgi:F-type H+-transporting ATPase subunit b
MNPVLLLAESQTEGQIQQIASSFGVDWTHLLAQVISFSIVCAILHRFAYKPILKMLEERRQQIAQGLSEREKIKAELARTESQRQEILVQTNAQANQLIEEAHTAAARVQQQETQKAIAAGELILRQSREAAAQERASMLLELKREVGQLVVQTTAVVTGKILTKEDQHRMAEETVKKLASAA